MIRHLAGAFAFATVLPVRTSRPLGMGVVAALPVVGAALGVCAGAVMWCATSLLGFSGLLGGAIAVVFGMLATRGLHVDGLSDTVDGLGCYGPPERALSVMRGGTAGPFGVAAIVTAILLQALAFSEFAGSWRAVLAVAVAATAGRVAVLVACRRGVPAAPGSTLGSAVASTQPVALVAGWTAAVAVAAVFATDRPWQGPLVVVAALAAPTQPVRPCRGPLGGVAALAATTLLVRHCVRRFGGITGDVLGAAVEMTVTLTALGFAIS